MIYFLHYVDAVVSESQVRQVKHLVGWDTKASLCRWNAGKLLKVPGTMETPDRLL